MPAFIDAKFSLVLACCLFVTAALWTFHRHSVKNYAFRFFTLKSFSYVAAYLGLIGLGIFLMRRPTMPLYFGWIALAGGIAALCRLIYMNCRRTTISCGIAGSVAQIVLVTVFAPTGFFMLFMTGGALIVLFAIVQPVFVVNREA